MKVNFKLMRNEKIGIIGKNGAGKSSFLKTISGDLVLDYGKIKIKKDIDFSFFNQDAENFDDNKSITNNLKGSRIDINEENNDNDNHYQHIVK